MKILCVSATKFEIKPLIDLLGGHFEYNSQEDCFVGKNLKIEFLVTGMGSVATTYALTKALSNSDYGLVLNLGIAGSFDKQLPLGSLVHVTEEIFGDLGFRNQHGFSTLFDEGFQEKNAFPFKKGSLVNPIDPSFLEPISHIIKVKGLTVNSVTEMEEEVNMRKMKFKANVETMEGAAVFYVCLLKGTPFLEIRALSNWVGIREKSQWETGKAITNLADELIRILNQMDQNEI